MDSTLSDRDAADVALLTRPSEDVDKMLADAVPPPACEWRAKRDDADCGAPASWIMSLSCGHSYYYDEEHAEAMKAQGIGDESAGPTLCDSPLPPRHPRYMRATVSFDRIAS